MSAFVSWHADASARATCHVYPQRAPILWASDGTGFSLSLTDGGGADAVSVEHAAFARQFAEQAAVYARECERWAVQPPAESDQTGVPPSAA